MSNKEGKEEAGTNPEQEPARSEKAKEESGVSGNDVEGDGDREGGTRREASRNRVKPGRTVEGGVGARVKDVEPGNPGEDESSEDNGSKGERTGNGDISPDGSSSKSHTENDVGPGGEAFSIRVTEQQEKGEGREGEAEAVEKSSGSDEEGGVDGDEDEGGLRFYLTGGDFAVGGTRVGGVYFTVGPTIEAHSSVTSSNHCDEDEDEGLGAE